MTNGILLTRHNQEIAQCSPDPFPRERVGSGDETVSILQATESWAGPGNEATFMRIRACLSIITCGYCPQNVWVCCNFVGAISWVSVI